MCRVGKGSRDVVCGVPCDTGACAHVDAQVRPGRAPDGQGRHGFTAWVDDAPPLGSRGVRFYTFVPFVVLQWETIQRGVRERRCTMSPWLQLVHEPHYVKKTTRTAIVFILLLRYGNLWMKTVAQLRYTHRFKDRQG